MMSRKEYDYMMEEISNALRINKTLEKQDINGFFNINEFARRLALHYCYSIGQKIDASVSTEFFAAMKIWTDRTGQYIYSIQLPTYEEAMYPRETGTTETIYLFLQNNLWVQGYCIRGITFDPREFVTGLSDSVTYYA